MIFGRTATAAVVAISALLPLAAIAQPVAGSYETRDGRATTVVIACPSLDNSFTAGPCALAKTPVVTYAAPASSAVITANTAVTVFASGSISTGCDVINTGSAILYLDFTAVSVAGSATSIPLQPGQAYHCPFAPAGAVTAVAGQPESFVAVRY